MSVALPRLEGSREDSRPEEVSLGALRLLDLQDGEDLLEDLEDHPGDHLVDHVRYLPVINHVGTDSLLTCVIAGFSPPPGFGGPNAPPGGPRE